VRVRRWQRAHCRLAKDRVDEEFEGVNAVESCHGYRARSKNRWYRLVNISSRLDTDVSRMRSNVIRLEEAINRTEKKF
jgi:hypothetical protein